MSKDSTLIINENIRPEALEEISKLREKIDKTRDSEKIYTPFIRNGVLFTPIVRFKRTVYPEVDITIQPLEITGRTFVVLSPFNSNVRAVYDQLKDIVSKAGLKVESLGETTFESSQRIVQALRVKECMTHQERERILYLAIMLGLFKKEDLKDKQAIRKFFNTRLLNASRDNLFLFKLIKFLNRVQDGSAIFLDDFYISRSRGDKSEKANSQTKRILRFVLRFLAQNAPNSYVFVQTPIKGSEISKLLRPTDVMEESIQLNKSLKSSLYFQPTTIVSDLNANISRQHIVMKIVLGDASVQKTEGKNTLITGVYYYF